MSYKDIDNFILGLSRSEKVPLGSAAASFVTMKKLANARFVPEGPFAAPVEDVRAGLAQVAGYELQKEASVSLKYLLEQLQELSPEGFEVPGPFEKVAGRQNEIALEQQSLVAMEKLCGLVGENSPVAHTLRHFMKLGSARLDELMASPEVKEETAQERLMGRIQKIAQVVVPPPTSDSPEAYVARERQLQLDQAAQELAHTKMQLNQTAMAMQQAQQDGMAAQDQAAQLDQQLQETQAMLDQSSQESQTHQQQAVEAETRAAEHATQKMQLGMRVQQMRQALAEIASQDPVSETAANVNDLTAQGAPATPDQVAQEEEAMAVEEAAAAAPPAPPAKAEKEIEQAERAQQEADQQAAQAAQQVGGPAAAAAAPAEAPAPPGMAAA
jgi:hypothetical protein